MPQDNQLTMKFDPKVIEHLGVRMYSTLPPVLSELIANSYDADATKVEVELHDIGEKKIIVKDNGIGMSFDDINNKFLVIGRNRREDGESTPRGRKVIGKKGLGKLSFFGIVQTITINTVNEGKRNIFKMDWEDLMNSAGQYNITPEAVDEDVEGGETGTEIILENIKRASSFSKDLNSTIARFFIFDKEFVVSVKHNRKEPVILSNDMHFSAFTEEFSWSFPKDFVQIDSNYEYLSEIHGKILTTEKPIAPKFNARGISLFSRGKLVQIPYQFADSTSSHFFSYMTGWLKVDFIEDFPEDVISTNRQNLNWGHNQTDELHKYLEKCVQFVQSDWRRKRGRKRVKEASREFDIQDWVDSTPENIKSNLDFIVKELLEDLPEVQDGKINALLLKLREIVPPYPYYHWRNLHPIIRDPLKSDYKEGKYMQAAREGVVIYENEVKKKLGLDFFGVKLMHEAFKFRYSGTEKGIIDIKSPPKLQIVDIYSKSKTKIDMQEGQRTLSVGLVQAFRNPAHHETKKVLNKLFDGNDCLNILSLVSFLLYRLDSVGQNG